MNPGDPDKTSPDFDLDRTLGPEDSRQAPDPGKTMEPDATLGPDTSVDDDATIGPAGRKPLAGDMGDRTLAGSGFGDTPRVPVSERNIQVEGYEILDELGRGGMGVVYKARDQSLNRIVALKMILAGVHASDESIARFRTEAEAVAQLKHRGIVQVYDVGQADGQPYCALEFVDGGGLDELMTTENLSITQAVAIVEELAQAMSSAHQAGIVHRDLKPANVLISRGGTSSSSINVESLGDYRPKVTDFGLAKNVEQDSQQTRTGAIMGTPGYMAPEQARGMKRIGPAADIYSLGAILYHLVAGRPPFVGETPLKTIMQVLNDPPLAPRGLNSSVDRDLDTIILKCLEKEPAARYASAEHLAQDLRRYQTGMPIEARPVSGLERAGKWIRRKPWAAAMIGMIAVGLFAVIVGGAIFNRQLSIAYEKIDEERGIAVKALDDKSRALEAESRALEAESRALEESDLARKRAEESESVSRRRLIDNYVNNALQSMNENQMLRALPWLSEALAMETEPQKEAIHQLRFNLAVQNAPKPERTWLANSAYRTALFSGDGKQVASFTNHLDVLIYDIASNKVIHELKSPSQIVAFDITEDHRRAIVASVHVNAATGDFSAVNVDYRMWDVESGQVGEPFLVRMSDRDLNAEPHVSAARNCVFTRNIENGSVDLVNLASHEVICSFKTETQDVVLHMHRSGDFLAWRDGKKITVVNPDEPDQPVLEIEVESDPGEAIFGFPVKNRIGVLTDKLRLYDLTGNDPPTEYSSKNKGRPYVAVSPQTSMVALAWSEGQLELYAPSGKLIDKRRINHQVRRVFYSGDDNLLLVATRFEVLRFDSRTGNQIGSPIPSTFKPLIHAAISPDDQSLAICSGSGLFQGNGCLRIWNVNDRSKKVPLNEAGRESRISLMVPDQSGNLVAVRKEKNGALEIHDVSNRNRPRKLLTLVGKSGQPDSRRARWVAWSANGELIAIGLDDQLRVYRVATGEELSRCEIQSPATMVFNADATKLAVACGDRELVAIIDVASGTMLHDGLKHRRSIRAMRFVDQPDEVLVTASSDLNFRAFDTATGSRLEKENLRMVPHSVDFDLQHGRFVVGGERLGNTPGRVSIKDITTGKPLTDPVDLDAVVTLVRYSRSGKLIAAADTNGVVRIISGVDGTDQGLLMSHPDSVRQLHFSHDDRILMTVCNDGGLRLFDTDSGLYIASPMESDTGDIASQINNAGFLGTSYDIAGQAWQGFIWQIPTRQFSPEHASALSRFLSGSLISERVTIIHAPSKSLKQDFSNVTIRQMMDADLLQHLINN